MMKKYIQSAQESLSLFEEVCYDHSGKYLEEQGYKVKFGADYSISIKHRDSLMPRIEVETKKSESSNTYMFLPKLYFPEVIVDFTVSDVRWYLNRWSKVGEIAEKIYLFDFNPDDYKD